MSKDKQYSQKSLEEFLRYLEGNLSDRERNRIERNLLKDTFEEEAMEGLLKIGTDEAREDMAQLQQEIQFKVAPKRTFSWYRVAATVAVLLAVSAILFTVFNDNLDLFNREIAQSNTGAEETIEEPVRLEMEQETDEVEKTEPRSMASEPRKKEEEPLREEPALTREETAPPMEEPEPLRDEPTPPREEPETVPVETAALSVADLDEGLEDIAVETGETELIIAEEVSTREIEEVSPTEQPVMAAKSKKMEGAAQDNLAGAGAKEKALKAVVVSTPESQSVAGPDEIVIVEPVDMPGLTGLVPAQPGTGEQEFENYIRENIQFPPGSALSQGEVVLNLTVAITGRPENITVLESPGEPFSEEAIRLLNEGPDWKPAEKDNAAIEQAVNVRILFRK